MASIVTDQFRIFNASNFIDSINSSHNSYYVFLGLSNPTVGFGGTSNWDSNTPSPVDSFDYLIYLCRFLLAFKINTIKIVER